MATSFSSLGSFTVSINVQHTLFVYSDEELFGDFEDLETGESSMQTKEDKTDRDDFDDDDDESGKENDNNEGDEDERRLAKKKKLKESFNVEYPFISLS